MLKATLTFCSMIACYGILALPSMAADRRPNIILLMADDMGYECLSCNGGESYVTPHLDQLAAKGVRFTNCHSQPVCTPSRCKIMTGLSNVRNYVDFGLLKQGSRTFGHMLQDAGYQTAIIGKWQLYGREGNKIGKGTHPRDSGFHEYFLWQIEGRGSRYWKPDLERNGKVLETTDADYGPDMFVDYAKDFMARNRDQPFFLYYPMVLPHSPFVETPANKQRDGIKGHDAFAGMVSYTDDIVGRLVSHMKELNIQQNTLFLFAGDNGTNRSISSILDGKPIQGGKGLTIDSGTHVPLIVNWPGTIAPAVCQDLVDFSDFVPTLAEISSGTHPYAELADGQSFLPQLKGQKGSPRSWIYCFYHSNPKKGTAKIFARNHRWKLYADGNLFDVQADPDESAPVVTESDELKQIRLQLRTALDSKPSQLAVDATP